MSSTVPVAVVPRGFGRTARRDAWWVTPGVQFLVLSSFVVYATWAAFQNAHYHYGPYLSPFYAPEIWGDSPHAWFGPKPTTRTPCRPGSGPTASQPRSHRAPPGSGAAALRRS